MIANFAFPPVGFGPGTQPDPSDGPDLAYLPLPSGMQTYSMHLPEPEMAAGCAAAFRVLEELAAMCEDRALRRPLMLDDLPAADRALLAETLGEGEVACRLDAGDPLLAQEAVFAGVWRCRDDRREWVEVGAVPNAVVCRAFQTLTPAAGLEAAHAPGVVNAPALVVELTERAGTFEPGAPPHVVNLSLLPHTPEDLALFEHAFGRGAATILSRGYGNCRIEATAVEGLWRVRYFNSMDNQILDTFEVTAMPEVARAAPEDLADSAARIHEVLEALA